MALVSHLCPSVRRLANSAWAQLESLHHICFTCLAYTNRLDLGFKVITTNESSSYNTAESPNEGK